MADLTSAKIEMEFASSVWTEVTDVIVDDGVRVEYGTNGNRPLDRTASTGHLSFSLRNDDANSGSLEGYYSPNHANVRSGFGYGTPVRAVFTFGGTDYYKFAGKLVVIEPEPGSEQRRRTRCEAVDWIDDAADYTLRDVVPQADKRADELIAAIVSAMPATSQPTSTSYDTGNQVFPYAFYDLGEGEKALRALAKVVQSEFGFLAVIGDTSGGGKLRFFNRHSRAEVASSVTLDNTMIDVEVPASLDNVYNRVIVTTHPLRVDDETVVLFSLPVTPTSVRPVVAPSQTRTFWVEYRDPDSDETVIGAAEGVPVVASTDYTMNTFQAGGGDDVTGDFTVTVTYFASVAKVVVTNGGSSFGYITKLQGRGRGIYDRAPVTHESSSSQDYGERTIKIDMPYQNDANVGQGLADFVETQYNTLSDQSDFVRFNGNVSTTLMTHALAREPGDKVTLTEDVTGLSSVEVFIQRVRLLLTPGQMVWCEWLVAPSVEGDFFTLDVDKLDEAALGYA